jgi:hypothetical protein
MELTTTAAAATTTKHKLMINTLSLNKQLLKTNYLYLTTPLLTLKQTRHSKKKIHLIKLTENPCSHTFNTPLAHSLAHSLRPPGTTPVTTAHLGCLHAQRLFLPPVRKHGNAPQP